MSPTADTAATHSANFDEKVHKPQYYRTLAVARVKKANHAEKKDTWYLSKCLIFSTCFAFFTLELTILANIRKTRLPYIVILLKCILFLSIYLMNLKTSIMNYNFLDSEGLQGTHMDALNPFNSKLITFT